jgi:hypothetical protein
MNHQLYGGLLVSPIRRTIPCLLTVLLLGAVVTSSAAAASPAWWIAGTLLKAKSTAAVAETTNVTTAFSITSPAAGFECRGIKVEKAFIEGEKTAKGKSIVFESCKLTKPATCSIPATDPSEPLTATLEGTTGHIKLNFAPTTGTVLVAVAFEGSCALAGERPIKGTMACNYPNVETESVDHLLEFTATSGSVLKLGLEDATFTGIDEFWLEGKPKWSAK